MPKGKDFQCKKGCVCGILTNQEKGLLSGGGGGNECQRNMNSFFSSPRGTWLLDLGFCVFVFPCSLLVRAWTL